MDLCLEINWLIFGRTDLTPLGGVQQEFTRLPEIATDVRIEQACFVNYSIGIEGLFGK